MSKFCIVIPTYNDLDNLKVAINSCLNQDFQDYSIIVSDNNSTDGTQDYLSSLAGKHKKLSIFANNETLSKSENWNRAYSQAHDCDFLVNLHSDDYLFPNCLADISNSICKDTVLIHGGNFQESSKGLILRKKISYPIGYSCRGKNHKALMITNNSVGIVGTAFKQEVFHKIGGFNLEYTFFQDVHLWYEMSDYGDCCYTPKKFGIYRQKDGVNPKPFFLEIIKWYTDIIEKESGYLSDLASKTLSYKINRKIDHAKSFKDPSLIIKVESIIQNYQVPMFFNPSAYHFFQRVKNARF